MKHSIRTFTLTLLAFLVGIVALILKLVNWDTFPFGTAATQVGTFLLGSLQLFFIGFIGEYILNINKRIMKRPLVIEAERLNFDTEKQKEEVNV